MIGIFLVTDKKRINYNMCGTGVMHGSTHFDGFVIVLLSLSVSVPVTFFPSSMSFHFARHDILNFIYLLQTKCWSRYVVIKWWMKWFAYTICWWLLLNEVKYKQFCCRLTIQCFSLLCISGYFFFLFRMKFLRCH